MVVLSSAGIGLYFSKEIKSRIDDLKELKKLIGLLRGDIRYQRTPLPEAISVVAKRNSGCYTVFFEKVSERLTQFTGSTFSEIWKEAVAKNLTDTSLSKKDKLHLIRFGENLGYLDKDMQMNNLDQYLNQLEDEITELSKTVKEKTYLYSSLGIMGGIFITIILF